MSKAPVPNEALREASTSASTRTVSLGAEPGWTALARAHEEAMRGAWKAREENEARAEPERLPTPEEVFKREQEWRRAESED